MGLTTQTSAGSREQWAPQLPALTEIPLWQRTDRPPPARSQGTACFVHLSKGGDEEEGGCIDRRTPHLRLLWVIIGVDREEAGLMHLLWSLLTPEPLITDNRFVAGASGLTDPL